MDAICNLATDQNLIVVEDAAQAFGASLGIRKAGSFSTAASFSMNPMKVLGGYGEGGVVVTNDRSIYGLLRQLRHAGTTSDPKKIITNDCRVVSLNHKMDTINAALLLVALEYLPAKIKLRQSIAKRYDDELPETIVKQKRQPQETHGRYVYPIKTDQRNELKLYLEDSGIESKIMHEPLICDAPVYKELLGDVPVAREALASSLILPSHEGMSDQQITHVIQTVQSFYSV